jgi:hypothetical protein
VQKKSKKYAKERGFPCWKDVTMQRGIMTIILGGNSLNNIFPYLRTRCQKYVLFAKNFF